MADHAFNFEGGEKLNKMGASWFVSYAYYSAIDGTHMNWQRIESDRTRIAVFKRTSNFHQYWLEQVRNMADARLERNEIGLAGPQVKQMARALLEQR